MKPDEQQQPPGTALEPAIVAELRALVQKAKAGDVRALPRMRAILDQHPEVWQTVGDLERVVVRSWAELLGGDDPLSVESVRRKAEQFRAELEGANPTPLGRLLAGQVISGWLEMTHAQIKLADPGGSTQGQAGFNLRRVDAGAVGIALDETVTRADLQALTRVLGGKPSDAPASLPAAVLRRKAVVYVRQSTPAQVQVNGESRRRQYELVEVARRRGFREIEVIDDDLGRSAGGAVARPGFERLVAGLCAGEVGAGHPRTPITEISSRPGGGGAPHHVGGPAA